MTGPLKTPTQKTFRTGIWKTRILESWGFVEKPLNVSVLKNFFSLAKLLKGFYGLGFFEATQKRLLKRLRYRRESWGKSMGTLY